MVQQNLTEWGAFAFLHDRAHSFRQNTLLASSSPLKSQITILPLKLTSNKDKIVLISPSISIPLFTMVNILDHINYKFLFLECSVFLSNLTKSRHYVDRERGLSLLSLGQTNLSYLSLEWVAHQDIMVDQTVSQEFMFQNEQSTITYLETGKYQKESS